MLPAWLPTSVEGQLRGIAFPGVDNRVFAGDSVRHEIDALIADEPKSFAGFAAIKGPHNRGSAQLGESG